MRFQARLCPSCGLRFPVEFQSPLGRTCPACGANTEDVDAPWTAETVVRQGVAPGPRLEALLDNVRSLRNVGAMFRSADGAGVSALHLGGFTPTPSHPKLAKTALGSEKSIAWHVHKDAAAAAASLSREGKRLWALEGGPRAGEDQP